MGCPANSSGADKNQSELAQFNMKTIILLTLGAISTTSALAFDDRATYDDVQRG